MRVGVVVAAAALALSPAPQRAGTERPPGAARAQPAPRPRPAAGLPELAPLARAVLPAVVGIVTLAPEIDGAVPDMKELLERHQGQPPARQGLATGFLIHEDGWILTNAHVVEGAGRLEVDLGDEGGRVPGTVVGTDDLTDLALLKVNAPHPLPAVPLGDSDRLEIAEWILVVGNPFGLAHSVTLGIVSQVGRSEVAPQGRDGYYDFIQTDASINPGNSGGPLVNLRGEVVGIATAINATGQGIGFAIPINMAKDVLAQLREHGGVRRSWIGITVRELPREGGRRARPGGVVVTEVAQGSPAASAGIAPGDVITSFDGRAVGKPERLRWFVASGGVGRRVALSVRRGADERAVQVQLAAPPAGEAAAEAVSRAGPGRPE